jgi:hypothetical protein
MLGRYREIFASLNSRGVKHVIASKRAAGRPVDLNNIRALGEDPESPT